MRRSPPKPTPSSNPTLNFASSHTVPLKPSLDVLRSQAVHCTACDLYRTATQTVFGEGKAKSKIMLVGEQPGDQEDREGHPFVGPAGRLLNEALLQARIKREDVYVTNVVKHFKWAAAQRGKRRIHKKPRYSEIHACRPWLDAELEAVRPRVLICLGATAAQSLLGRDVSVLRQHGEPIKSGLAPVAIATIHPSAILRAPDADSRHSQMRLLVADLKRAAQFAVEQKAA